MTEFDPLTHARMKARKYEAEAISLREQNAKLIRMLALACEVGARQLDVMPVALCAMIEEIDRTGFRQANAQVQEEVAR